jgi:alpha-tubulin suppressor-like RCC1 family protein
MDLPTQGGCVRIRYQQHLPPRAWDPWPGSLARVLVSAILIGSLFHLGQVNAEAQPLDPTSRVAAGAAHSLALAADGTVWAWGENGRGQLGDGSTINRSSPVPVTGMRDVVALAAGGQSSYAVKRDGTLWAWGLNQLGSLGDGTTVDRHLPVQVPGLSDITAVAAGVYHVLALDANGAVWSWGSNGSGQLGDGTTNNRSLAGPVGGLGHVRGIAAGGGHSLAIEEDGTLWAWGANGAGQLGVGSNVDSSVPILVARIDDVRSVGAGMEHSVALRADGSVWSWGGNAVGQLGDGTFRQRNAPVRVARLPLIHRIAVGYYHSFALGPGGRVWAWGLNLLGELGDGTWVLRRRTPVALTTLADVTDVAGGGAHGLALTSGNLFYGWGWNASGQVGDGTRSMRRAPVWIQIPESEPTTVAAPVFSPGGGLYTSAQEVILSSSTPESEIYYTTDGSQPTPSSALLYTAPITIETETLLTARAYRDGWTPSDTVTATYQFNYGTLTPPSITPNGGTFISSIEVGLSAAAGAIRFTVDGSDPTPASTLYLGPFTLTATTTLKAAAFAPDWTPSAPAEAVFVIQVARPTFEPDGGFFTSEQAVTLDCDTSGARIHYTTNGDDPTDADPSVAPGESILVAEPLTLKARAYAPETTPSDVVQTSFEFGVATPTMRPPGGVYWRPTTVVLATTTPGAEIRFTTDGSDPDAGSPLYIGPLLVDASVTVKARAYRSGFTDSDLRSETYTIGAGGLAAGGFHSLALWPDGTVWAWGANDESQLGDDVGEARSIPGAVPGLEGVLVLSAGELHSLALKADGTTWAWGANDSGQLGNGTNTTRFIPAPVSGLADVVAIAAGGSHSLALSSDGTVWAWGENSEGQLGDGTTTPSALPVKVVEIEDVVTIAAGASHSLALKADGTLWAWGNNAFGQLGDGGDQSASLPIQVVIAGDVNAVAAGGAHSLTVTMDGTIWAWGDNSSGQLGTGDGTGSSSTPMQVVVECVECSPEPFVDARAVSAGRSHSLALKSDGTVWAWGEGSSGEIGDGDFQSRPSPVPVDLPGEMILVSAGGSHNLALGTDGTVWAWGANDEGQIGDGTTEARPWPVSISVAGLLWKSATPTFSVPAGTYSTELSVTLVAATPGAAIHYTTDGREPTEIDPAVSSGTSLLVGRSTLLTARTFHSELAPSNLAAADYLLVVTPPVLDPPPASYDAPLTVTVTESTAGATLRYTTNGFEPTEIDPEIPSGATFFIDANVFLWVKAFREGWQSSSTSGLYRMAVLTPTFSPPPGSYNEVQHVTISVPTSGAVVHYTTDGSHPTPLSPVAKPGVPVRIDKSLTLRALGFRADLEVSDLAAGAYNLKVATPVMTPPVPTGLGPESVILSSATAGATIRYTLNGPFPDGSSPQYTAPILVDAPATLRARAFKSGWTPSDFASAFYDIVADDVATPKFSTPPGTYATAQEIVITSDTPDAVIRVTTNGLDPIESDPQIPSGTSISVDRYTVLKAKAWKDGLGESAVRTGTYFITGAVAAGANFTLALKADGSVWAWGANDAGQLGNGSVEARVPMPVAVSLPTPVMAVAAGGAHALAIDRDGAVWAWGLNANGQVGNGTTVSAPTPVQVTGLSGIVAIAAGGEHSLALAKDGKLWAWGENSWGRLGDGTTIDRHAPVRVTGLDSFGITAIAAGNGHSLALGRGGALYAWGVNFNGQLGRAPDIADHPFPTRVNVLPLASVSGGAFHSLGLETGGSAEGRRWYWGGTPSVYADPGDITMLDAGEANIFVTLDGSAWTSAPLPKTLNRALGPQYVVSIATGQGHFAAVTADGTVWTWGTNGSGELGDGTLDAKDEPGLIDGLRLVENISAGEDPDGDWLTDAEENRWSTDPRNPDTNGDGIPDGLAVALGLSPTHPDMDGDGVGNATELELGTDPFRADSDNDGFLDGIDCFPLDSSQNQCLVDDPSDHTPPGITILVPDGMRLISSIP